MRILFLFLALLIPVMCVAQASVSSPDNTVNVSITGGEELMLSARFGNQVVLEPSAIGIDIKGLTEHWAFRRTQTREVNEIIVSPVPEKRRRITDHYRELTVQFRSGISLQVRAYNDGFAYRFVTSIKDSITITKEVARYRLPQNTYFHGSPVNKRDDADIFHTSFEEPYLAAATDSVDNGKLFFSPILVSYPQGRRMVVTESDIEDYPGMFLRFRENRVLEGVNAPFPLAVHMTDGEFPQEVVTQRADYIARTKGKRTLPWRVFLLSERDRDLPSNDIVYRLGAPSRIKDTSWIKPGQGTDEWIIGISLFNVPFRAGVNTETYKYYIDFAKRFGFERIMMDAGWSDYKDLFAVNPDIDMDAISAYAKQNGVSLSMWTLASTLDRQLEPALEQFIKWGVDFIMTDFMDRDDQKIVNFYHRITEACARKKIMVMFHGGFKPAGFSRTWPNAVTREGVLGSEYNIWSEKATPEHDLLLPFIRMTAGPMDYEPGLLDNATKEKFRPIGGKVMSMGTRMHQAAMFVVYESPIQIFSGNPSQGTMESEFMNLLGSIPTVWDETIIRDAKLGEYIVTARKKGDDWFIAGMTNWIPRDITLSFDFLDDAEYDAILAVDGVNADNYASDYRIEKRKVKRDTKVDISMAPGGGFIVVLRK